MKIAYNGFTKYANALEKPPLGISNLKMCIKEACDELGYEFSDYYKNPDVQIIELPLIGGFNYSHIDAAKTLKMLDSSKKICICFDDLTFIKPFLRLKDTNKLPFVMSSESKKFINKWNKFLENVFNNKYDLIQVTYQDEDLGIPCNKKYLFDYSFLSKYTNCYFLKERRPVSASAKLILKNENSSDMLVLSGLTEQECFQKLCEHRVCYIRSYSQSLSKYWVRTRFAQSYHANALVVGLEYSPFEDDKTYIVSLNDYYKMTDEEFEEKVKLQKETFLKHTMTRERAIEVIRKIAEDE